MRRNAMVNGALAALLGLAAAFAVAVPASAAPGDGIVSGTVVVPGGHSATGVDVYLASASGDAVVAGPINPDGGGGYQFTGVADGTYTVFAETPADTLAWQWAGAGRDAAEADAVTVADGSVVGGVDFSLVAGATISGTVTVPSGHAPEDTGAFADRPAGSAALAPAGTVTAAGQYTDVAGDGTYTIGNLPDLAWKVRFSTSGQALATRYHGGAYSEAAATVVSPTAGAAVSGVDVTLEATRVIVVSATLKDAASSVCYAIRNVDSSVTRSGCSTAGVSEDSVTVPPGSYIVSAWESNATHGDTAHLWWNNTTADRKVEANATGFVPSALTDDPIVKTTFDLTGLRFPDEPAVPGSLVVTVTEWVTGNPATTGCVEAYGAAGTVVGNSCTPVAGVFTIAGLTAGSYKVRAYNQTGMVPMWFGPAATRTAATAVTVADDATTPVAIRVVPPYTAVGKTVDGAGVPISGGTVELYTKYHSSSATLVHTAVTGADGWYLLDMSGCSAQPLYSCIARYVSDDGRAESFYSGSLGLGSFTNVPWSATAATVLAQQQQTWQTFELNGVISVPEYFTSDVVCLVLENYVGASVLLSAAAYRKVQCGHRGDPFTFEGLSQYNHHICAVDAPTAPNGCAAGPLVNDYPTLYSAAGGTRAISVTFGTTLTRTVRIGTSSGPLLTHGCVELWTDSGSLVSTVCDPVDGIVTFPIANDTLTYRLKVRGVPGVAAYWLTREPRSSSGAIGVVDGTPSTGTLTVAPGGTVSGTITLPSGTAADHGCVTAWDVEGVAAPVTACADLGTGAYSLALTPGAYRLEYFAETPDVATLWSGNVEDIDSAQVISVTASSARTINVALPPAGGILVGADDSQAGPVVNGCFHAVNGVGAVVVIRCLDNAGEVLLDSLAPGSYTVYFGGNDATSPAWFGGSTPQVVTVAAGVSSSVRIAAEPQGTVAATVTGAAGAPAEGGCLSAYSADSGELVASTCESAGGEVRLPVPAGEYQLFFSGWGSPGALVDEWWSATDDGVPQEVTIGAGSEVAVAAALSESSGTIRVAGSYRFWIDSAVTIPAFGGCAYAYAEDGALAAMGCAEPDGSVVDLHVGAGSFAVYLRGWEADRFGSSVPLAPEWWQDSTAFGSSNLVASDGSTIVALSAQFGPDIVVTGTVSGTTGAVSGGTIEAYDKVTGEWLADALIGSTGQFTLTGLSQRGNLVLRVTGVPGYPTQWYGGNYGQAGKANFAATFQLSAPQAGTDLPVRLSSSGSVAGVLEYHPSFDDGPICASVWAVNTSYVAYLDGPGAAEYVDEDCGARGETFRFDGLVANALYAIKFSDESGHSFWKEDPVTTRYWEPFVAILRPPAGGVATLVQAPYTLYAPSGKYWPDDEVALTVVSATVENGAVPATLYQDSGTPSVAVQLTFVNGRATLPIDVANTYNLGGSTGFSVSIQGGATSNTVSVLWDQFYMELWRRGSGIPGTSWTGDVIANYPWSGVGTVWYMGPDGIPRESSTKVVLVDGVGTFRQAQATVGVNYGVEFYGWFSGWNYAYVEGGADWFPLDGPTSVTRGESVTLSVSLPDGLYGTAYVQTTANGPWANVGGPVPITNGTASIVVTPTALSTSYRVLVGTSTYSRVLTITTTPPAVSISGPSTAVTGSTMTFAAALDPAVSGTAAVWAKPAGGAWAKTATTFAVTNGVGGFTTTAPWADTSYRVELLGATSNEVAVVATPPAVTLSGPSTLAIGGTARFTVAVSPAMSGTAGLQYKVPGGQWVTSSMTVPVVAGAASFSLAPTVEVSYRVIFGSATSNAVTVVPIAPTVTLSGPTTIAVGGTARFTVAVSPALTGTATLQYMVPGGSWITSGMTVPVSNGTASFSLAPTVEVSYRVMISGGVSNAVTVVPTVPTVTLSGPSTIAVGGTARFTVAVSPAVSGTAQLQYKVPTGSWVTSSMTVPVSNGSASFSLAPTSEVAYRVMISGGTSNAVTVIPTAPTVTLSGPSTLALGGTARFTVAVSPAVSGTATLQYMVPGGSWITSGMTVPVSNGAASFSLAPMVEVSYRVMISGGVSNAITVVPTVPTVTLSGPSTLALGGTARFTIAVSPAVSGIAQLQYKVPTGAWVTSSMTVPVVGGAASFSLAPTVEVSYRVMISGGVSNAITVVPTVPTVTLSGPSTLAFGGTARFTVAVSPAVSGTAQLQYKVPTGAWVTSSMTVPVTNGAATFSLAPTVEVSYRVMISGGTSNAVTVVPTVPTVTLSGPSTLAPGGTARFTVAVSPAVTGTATLQYKVPTGAWITSGMTVPVTNGAASFSLAPTVEVSYRVMISGGTSNAVTVVPTGAA